MPNLSWTVTNLYPNWEWVQFYRRWYNYLQNPDVPANYALGLPANYAQWWN